MSEVLCGPMLSIALWFAEAKKENKRRKCGDCGTTLFLSNDGTYFKFCGACGKDCTAVIIGTVGE